VNTAIRARLLLALAIVVVGVTGALVAPDPVPAVAVRASHAAPMPRVTAAPALTHERTAPPVANERLRTDI
jgi:hypothetical protein